jgi:hypothetical protein
VVPGGPGGGIPGRGGWTGLEMGLDFGSWRAESSAVALNCARCYATFPCTPA